jgi:hypothetical protein
MSLPQASGTSALSPSTHVPSSPPVVASQSVRESGFVDRRSTPTGASGRPERRQFGSSHAELSEAGRELALAIDRYKIAHHRRYLTCDEMLKVLSDLGYAKQVS